MKCGVLWRIVVITLAGQIQSVAADVPVQLDGVSERLLEKLSAEPLAKLTRVDIKGLPELDLAAVPSDFPNGAMLKEVTGICVAVPEGFDLAKVWKAVDLALTRIKDLNTAEGLKGRAGLVLYLPGDDKSAVIFFPPDGIRAGKFLIEFDAGLGKITDTKIYR